VCSFLVPQHQLPLWGCYILIHLFGDVHGRHDRGIFKRESNSQRFSVEMLICEHQREVVFLIPKIELGPVLDGQWRLIMSDLKTASLLFFEIGLWREEANGSFWYIVCCFSYFSLVSKHVSHQPIECALTNDLCHATEALHICCGTWTQRSDEVC
jgi:hypothetical protein